MAPAPETASKNFMNIVDDLWQKNSGVYLTSPKQFLHDVNKVFADNKLFVSIHSSEVLPGYLVAARCMVQNVLTPEYFPLVFVARNGSKTMEATGCFRDTFAGEETDIIDKGCHGTRNCYKVVMVPGAVDWWLKDFSQAHTTALCSTSEGLMDESPSHLPVKVSQFIAKVFDDGSPELRPNTVVDVYGYLSSPVHFDVEEESSEHFNIHVLRAVEVSHVIPQVTPPPGVDRRSIRSDLVKEISLVLGSTTNADIFVNFLVSTTFSRPSGGTPLCFLPLNIVGVEDKDAVNLIVEMIQQLMPKVKLLTITSELLSEKRFAPFKDYVSDDLVQGELQLSDGTVLVIIETQLPYGTIPVGGFAETNLKVLEDLIVDQKIEYDYSFYKVPIYVDYSILILSRKASRFFKTPFSIPLQSTGVRLSLIHPQEKRNFLQQSRSDVRSVSLTDEMAKKIQDGFVTMCSSLDGMTDKAALLNEMLIMSRLIASSNGSPCLEFEHWEHAVRISLANSAAMALWRSQ